jgi:MtN3 and saliva related transmembrane protein
MTPRVIEIVGYAGAVCNAISFVPQLLRVIRLRSARDISYSMFLIFAIGSGLWLVYGASVNSLPVMLANATTLLLSFSIFVLKLGYGRQTTEVAALVTSDPEKVNGTGKVR